MWELPGGKVESGESMRDSLRRELAEELSISIKTADLYYFDQAFYEYGYRRIQLVCYRVGVFSGELRVNEHADWVWAKINSLGAYRFAPADVPIISRILRYAHRTGYSY